MGASVLDGGELDLGVGAFCDGVGVETVELVDDVVAVKPITTATTHRAPMSTLLSPPKHPLCQISSTQYQMRASLGRCGAQLGSWGRIMVLRVLEAIG